MLSYKDLTKHFGSSLLDEVFQSFLARTFSDLTEYNILESDYIISQDKGIELGFANKDAVYDDDDRIVLEAGNPIFSHFIIYPKSTNLIGDFPFNITFTDSRTEITGKAGRPTQTNEGYSDFLNKNFLVDNYKLNNIVIAFDYDAEQQILNHIQFRDNNLVDHLKL